VAELLEAHPAPVLAGIWLRGGARARRRIEWFWSRGRAVRPLLSGDEVVALGVRRGPAVGACLAALRRRRLDGAVTTIGQERSFVTEWLRERRTAVDAEAGPSGLRREGPPPAARRTDAEIGRARSGLERGAAKPGHRGRRV
jgi:hypothetical protein